MDSILCYLVSHISSMHLDKQNQTNKKAGFRLQFYYCNWKLAFLSWTNMHEVIFRCRDKFMQKCEKLYTQIVS
ncbi:predicted protein [Enterococcus faecium 1,231,501]|nr:predicted protein [Enterococcus faecium 1,231,501]